MDDKACRRLACAIVLNALRGIRDGDNNAENWLYSEQAKLFLDILDMGELDLDEVILGIKNGRRQLTMSGSAYYRQQKSEKIAIY